MGGGPYRLEAEIISQVRDKADLAEYAKDYVEGLKQKGTRLSGRCPFHEEKTASFSIDLQKRLYHCFGCQAGGDIFSFYMQTRGVEFLEAVRQIAEKEGITIPSSKGDKQKKAEEILIAAHRYFIENIGSAREYLTQKRRLSEETIRGWRIGYAPPHGLTSYLQKQGFSQTEAARVGLISPSKRIPGNRTQWYDFFRSRVMLPIYDSQSHLVGFIGRAVNPDSEIKYLNSPEKGIGGRTLYSKSKILLGLPQALPEIKKKGEAILTEGYFDIISAWQRGVKNVVAPSGTAFTEQQAELLARYTSCVRVMMDGDPAGIRAAKKTARTLFAAGLNPSFSIIPDGKDLDDIMKGEDGLTRFSSLPRYDLIDFHLQTTEVKNPDDKLALLTEIVDSFQGEKSFPRRMLWIAETAKQLGIDPAIVRELYLERFDQSRFAEEKTKLRFPDSLEDVARIYIANLLTVPPEYARQFFEKIPPESFIFSPQLREVYQLIIQENKSNGPFQSYLPLSTPRSLPSRQGQLDFVTEGRRTAAFEYLKQKRREGVLSHIPFELMKVLSEPLPKMLDECVVSLKNLVAIEERECLIEELNQAVTSKDEEKIPALIEKLKMHGRT